jgi:hypothetical protein
MVIRFVPIPRIADPCSLAFLEYLLLGSRVIISFLCNYTKIIDGTIPDQDNFLYKSYNLRGD